MKNLMNLIKNVVKGFFILLFGGIICVYGVYNFFDGILWNEPVGYVEIPLSNGYTHWQEDYGNSNVEIVGVYHEPSGGISGYLFGGITIHPVTQKSKTQLEFLSDTNWQEIPPGIKVIDTQNGEMWFTEERDVEPKDPRPNKVQVSVLEGSYLLESITSKTDSGSTTTGPEEVAGGFFFTSNGAYARTGIWDLGGEVGTYTITNRPDLKLPTITFTPTHRQSFSSNTIPGEPYTLDLTVYITKISLAGALEGNQSVMTFVVATDSTTSSEYEVEE